MAILEMNKIIVCGLHENRKEILETLHKKEIIEISETLTKENTYCAEANKSIVQFNKYTVAAEKSLEILDDYKPEKSSFFSGRRILPEENYHMSSSAGDDTLHKIHRIIVAAEKIDSHRNDINKICAKQAALEPYSALDIPMNITQTKHTLIKVGSIPEVLTDRELEKKLSENRLNNIYFNILGVFEGSTYVQFIFLKPREGTSFSLPDEINFSPPPFNFTHHTPKRKIEILEEAKCELESDICDCIAEIERHIEYRREIELFHDHMLLRIDKYRTLQQLIIHRHSFIISGYIPKKYTPDLYHCLESVRPLYIETKSPEEDDDSPVAFENNTFTSPVESIVETYSMPSPTDVDPNPITAFFYYLFFGMMFSDAGYGMILMLVCGYLGFGKRLEEHRRINFRMFFFCGISTVFWGLMYGSFFGNMINVVSTSFFHRDITLSPIWLDPVSQSIRLLLAGVAMGLIQILTGLGIKFYVLCKQKKVWDAFFDAGLWIAVLSGIGLLAAGIGSNIPMLTEVGRWTSLVSAAGLMITGGRKSPHILGKVFGGTAGLYNVTGYMSDALSYCRLMALGLATGSISNVVNLLGSMFGSSATGAVMFIIVALFGHALNFSMNILGAYVHTNRLQYVEFFSKFYEGGGRKFEPFCMRTKYYRFKKD